MGVVANVGINVDARSALQRLRQVAQASKKVEDALKKKGITLRRIGASYERMARNGLNGIRDLEASAAKLGRRMRTVSTAVKAAGAAFVAYKAIQTGISRVESERRIKLVASAYGEVAGLQAAAAASAEKFKLSQTEANQALANAYARLRPLGVTLEDIKSTFNGFNTAAKLGGATAEEASAAFTQLSQALGSGALRGDEFRSIAEQAPLVLQAISDETGVATGKLKEYAAEGLLTSDIVIKALRRIEEEGADKLTEALGGPEAAIKDFQNALEDVASSATTSIIPELTAAFKDIAQIIRDLEEPINFIGGLISGLLSGISTVTTRIRQGAAGVDAQVAAAEAARRQVPLLERITPEGQAKFNKLYEKELQRRLAIVDGAVPGQLPPSAAILPGDTVDKGPTSVLGPLTKKGRKGRTPRERKPEKSLEQQIRERAALLQVEKEISQARLQGNEQLQIQLEAYKRQLEIKQRELASGLEAIELDRNGVQLEEKLELLRRNKAEQQRQFILGLFEEDDARKQALQTLDLQITKGSEFVQQLNQIKNLVFEQGLSFEEAYKRVSQLKEGISETEQILNSVGQAISTGIVDAITSAVEGTKTLGEVASNVLRNIASLLLNAGVSSLIGGVGGGGLLGTLFPGRANGGPVTGSKPYVVGERGPELFVPRSSGTIIPNDKMMGGTSNVVVNVDASGSKVEGDSDRASQFGKAIGAAIQAELIKQKRPGGLLANT